MSRRPIRFCAAITIALAGIALSALPLASAAPAAKPILTFGLPTVGPNLDPALNPDGAEEMLSLSYAALTHVTPQGTVIAGLATSWRYLGSGNKTFEMTLRHDAQFSDGTPVTAAAVKSWLTYYAKATGPFAKLVPITSVTTNGKWTVVVHLGVPTPGLAVEFSDVSNYLGSVASPKALTDPSMLDTQTDGAGPYVVVPSQSVAGNKYVFVPNKHYYDPAAIRFSKVIVEIITNPATLFEAIKSGQLDVAEGDVTTASSATAAGLTITTAPAYWAGFLIMDRGPKLPDGTTANPLASVMVRQALNYAINRKAIVAGLLGKYATPTSEVPTTDGFDPKYANYYPYNPGKAKALLAAAGYPNGFSINVEDENAAGTLGDPLLQAISQNLSAVGVTLNSTPEPTENDWVQAYLGGSFPASGSFYGPVGRTNDFYVDFLAPKALGNQHGGDDPTLDQLAQEGASAASPARYWKQMVQRIVTQADEVVVLDSDSLWYSNRSIGGVAFNLVSGLPLPTEWYAKNS